MSIGPARPRVLGVYARDAAVASAAIRCAAARCGEACRVVERRTATGTLAVALHGSGWRAAGVAERETGSLGGDSAGDFAVVDGELYSGDGPSSDARRVLEAYEQSGIEGLGALDGHAGMAVWDEARQRLLLLRDPDGLAPLFFAATPQALFWASDLASLLPHLEQRAVDRTALDFLLAEGYVASPMTLVAGIARLPAGEVLVATGPGRHHFAGFARYSGQPKVTMGRTERTRRFGELFEQAVRRRVSPGRATGVLVSSGIDSTLTLAVLRRVLDVPARAYTFRYEGYAGWKNEGDGARLAARHLGAPHEEIAISAAGIIEAAPRLVREYGEPFTFGLHSYELGPVAADGVEVLFSGQGRDYLMSRAQRLQARYGALPAWARRALEVIPALARPTPPVARRIRSVIDGCGSWGARIYGEQTTPAAVRAALHGAEQTAAHRQAAVALLEQSADRFRTEAPLDRLLLPEQRLRGNDLYTAWNHWWGDAHGIAVRQPFRDRELLDFTYRLKHPELRKMEQRRYAESLLPREVAYAPKRHQLPPLAEWLREGGPLLGYAREQLSEERVASSGLFEASAVRRLVDAHALGRANHEWTIWVLITTLLWRDEVLKPAGG